MFNTVKSLATIAVLAVAAGSATASAADTANVSPQPTLKSGQISPVRIPGTKVRKGTKLRSGQALVSTRVRVANGITVRFKLSCPGSKVLVGLGSVEGDKAYFNLAQHGSYVGKHAHAVKLRADADKKLPEANGTIYGLCHS